MFLRILDRLEEILIATLMALATFIIFLAVMHRYLVGIPLLYPLLFPINLSWAQELCIYMFVWVAKFGAAYGVRTGIHVGVAKRRGGMSLFCSACSAAPSSPP